MNSTPTAVPRSVTVRRRKTVARVLAGRALGHLRKFAAAYLGMKASDVVPPLVVLAVVGGPSAMPIFGAGMSAAGLALLFLGGVFALPAVFFGPWLAARILPALSRWWAGVLAEADDG